MNMLHRYMALSKQRYSNSMVYKTQLLRLSSSVPPTSTPQNTDIIPNTQSNKVEETIKAPTFFQKVKKFGRDVNQLRKGFFALISDVTHFVSLTTNLKKDVDHRKWSLNDIRVHYSLRTQIGGIVHILILMAIPLGQWVALPIVARNPRKYLTPHFWTNSQKEKYKLLEREERFQSFKPILSILDDSKVYERCDEWQKVMQSIKMNKVPNLDDILDSRKLFLYDGPFSLDALPKSTLELLMKMHCLNYNKIVSMKSQLTNHTLYLYLSDYSFNMNPQGATKELIRKFAFERGVDDSKLTDDEIAMYMKQWLEISVHIGYKANKMVLFLPAMLGSIHPTYLNYLENMKQ